ncbi:hypothetical protein OG230_32750 [Streptomyces sp. NBC_00234]|uniref:hypothetical protein n=1 Tax=Streptomyces sp. NBC_00234 TaxID=2903638 RepID=UPI002E2C6FFA|nr:hypothetical protein [Streptomyces sp. NBC_00234]
MSSVLTAAPRSSRASRTWTRTGGTAGDVLVVQRRPPGAAVHRPGANPATEEREVDVLARLAPAQRTGR